MSGFIDRTIPKEQLRKLEFLLGEMTGVETLRPPGQAPIQFNAIVSGSWEECERFIKIDFFGNIPGLGVETFRTLITWSEQREAYRLWAFSSTQEEPLHMVGDFDDSGNLVFISDPWNMPWGLQKMRSTFIQRPDGSLEYLSELWDPEGYKKYCHVIFSDCDAFVSRQP